MGMSIREMVITKDPDPQKCWHPDCMVCKTKPGVCMKKGGVYKITCLICKTQGRNVVYVGETGRTLWYRGAEHFRAIEKYYEESPLIELHRSIHPDAPRQFQMKPIGIPKTNLMRQVAKAHDITKARINSEVMNRRGEWGQNLPPRLTVETDSEVTRPTKRRARTPGTPYLGPTERLGPSLWS